MNLLAAATLLISACGTGAGPDSDVHTETVVSGAVLNRPSAPKAKHPDAIKAIWVTRFDYKTKADLNAIFTNCADAGFNTVLLQVRGNATAFFDSPFEPWAEQLGGESPGFDPLASAVELAKRMSISLHAWINLLPAWWGDDPSLDPEQVTNAHPEWLWYDQYGKRQALSDKFYVSLNPCLPAVRDYLRDVVVDIARRYDVEGIHLDYARFPNEVPATPAGSDIDYPRDAVTLAIFQGETGLTLEASGLSDSIQASWNQWRTEKVTQTVEGIRDGLMRLESPPVLSVAVKAEADGGLDYFQDASEWVRRGLVDAVFPMNYVQDPGLFDLRNASWLAVLDQVGSMNGELPHFIVGVRAAAKEHGVTRRLIERALDVADGFCLFAYSNLFDSTNVSIDIQDAAASRERVRRRAELIPFIADS